MNRLHVKHYLGVVLKLRRAFRGAERGREFLTFPYNGERESGNVFT